MSRVNRTIVALLMAAFITTAAGADEKQRFEKQFSRTVTYSGGTVTVDHRFGSVNIRTGSAREVTVRASIRSSDPEFGDNVGIEVTTNGSGVQIETDYPEGRLRRNRNSSYSVDYQIVVPPNAPVRVSNRFGSVQATGLAAGSEIVNGHGSIQLSDSRGPQTVQNSFGSIDVRNIAGKLVATNTNGSIRAEEIRGTAEITNRFGSVNVTKTSGGTSIRNANGSVEARQVLGPLSVVNAFGSILAGDVEGNLDVEGGNSRIQIRGVRGDASVNNTFGSIEVRDLSGSATVDNRNGSVSLTGIGRSAAVKTTFASVTLKDVKGSIDVQNQNGAISVSGAPPCQPISLRTSFSTINLALPANASYAVNARTTFGRIESALPITVTSIGGQSTVGTIGRGACKLELVNANGNINIE